MCVLLESVSVVLTYGGMVNSYENLSYFYSFYRCHYICHRQLKVKLFVWELYAKVVRYRRFGKISSLREQFAYLQMVLNELSQLLTPIIYVVHYRVIDDFFLILPSSGYKNHENRKLREINYDLQRQKNYLYVSI